MKRRMQTVFLSISVLSFFIIVFNKGMPINPIAAGIIGGCSLIALGISLINQEH